MKENLWDCVPRGCVGNKKHLVHYRINDSGCGLFKEDMLEPKSDTAILT